MSIYFSMRTTLLIIEALKLILLSSRIILSYLSLLKHLWLSSCWFFFKSLNILSTSQIIPSPLFPVNKQYFHTLATQTTWGLFFNSYSPSVSCQINPQTPYFITELYLKHIHFFLPPLPPYSRSSLYLTWTARTISILFSSPPVLLFSQVIHFQILAWGYW